MVRKTETARKMEDSLQLREDIVYVKSSVADPDPDVLGLPDPDPLLRGTDPALDPSTIKQKWSDMDPNDYSTYGLRYQ